MYMPIRYKKIVCIVVRINCFKRLQGIFFFLSVQVRNHLFIIIKKLLFIVSEMTMICIYEEKYYVHIT